MFLFALMAACTGMKAKHQSLRHYNSVLIIFLFPPTYIMSLSLSLTQWHADAVALGVQQASDLGEVAVEAAVILVHGALEEESIFGVYDSSDAFLCALHKYTGLLRIHVVPHPLIRLISRVLQRGIVHIIMYSMIRVQLLETLNVQIRCFAGNGKTAELLK